MRVYLDMCCFNRPYDNQSQPRIKLESEAKLEVQDQIRIEQSELCWSDVLDVENAKNPHRERRQQIDLWIGFAEKTVDLSESIETEAQVFAGEGIKALDSLHLASAVDGDCDVFLTTDDGILKKRDRVTQIRILNPVEFIIEQGTSDDD